MHSKGRKWRHMTDAFVTCCQGTCRCFTCENETDCSEKEDDHDNTLLLIAQSMSVGLSSNFHRVLLTSIAIQRYQTFHILDGGGTY